MAETGIAARLRLTELAVARARLEFERHDLIAYGKPLCQVLSFLDPLLVRAVREGGVSRIESDEHPLDSF